MYVCTYVYNLPLSSLSSRVYGVGAREHTNIAYPSYTHICRPLKYTRVISLLVLNFVYMYIYMHVYYIHWGYRSKYSCAFTYES